MTDLVPTEDIERIVGVARHSIEHWGRAVSAEQTVYILHSKACLARGGDLCGCPYSEALDKGIEMARWNGYVDMAVPLWVSAGTGRLLPLMANPRVGTDEDGTLDDFLATDVQMIHFEALDDSQWYATVKLANGELWQLNFGAINTRARGYARAEQVS
jgi:hypothetical protein